MILKKRQKVKQFLLDFENTIRIWRYAQQTGLFYGKKVYFCVKSEGPYITFPAKTD